MKTEYIGLATMIATATMAVIYTMAVTFVVVSPARPSNTQKELEETRRLIDPNKRNAMLAHYEDASDSQTSDSPMIQFEQCKGKTVEECEALINQMNVGADFVYVVHEVRQRGVDDYNRLGLNTDFSGTVVNGINGDGVVKFSNPDFDGKNIWCLFDRPCINPSRVLHVTDQCCFNVGPWDCFGKYVEDCCTDIRSSIPGLDYRGNMIECKAAYPLGSEQNPFDRNRVTIRVNSDGHVVGEPHNG